MVTFAFSLTAYKPIINLISVNFMDKACGLDVHKDSVFACILDEEGKKILKSVTEL